MMTETDLGRITKTLRREAAFIAQLAARELASQVGPGSLPEAMALDVPDGEIPLSGRVSGLDSMDEVALMVQEGFQRFSHVVALSVLVDEPGLIADDLYWLKRLYTARQLRLGDMAALQGMVQAYVGACALVLDDSEHRIVQDVVARALALMWQEGERSSD